MVLSLQVKKQKETWHCLIITLENIFHIYISIRFWVLFETKLYLFIQQFTVDRKEIVISKNIVSSNPKLDCGRMRKTKATLFWRMARFIDISCANMCEPEKIEQHDWFPGLFALATKPHITRQSRHLSSRIIQLRKNARGYNFLYKWLIEKQA